MQLDLFSTKHSIRKDKDTKVCNKCNLELPVDCFSFHGGSNYLRPECKKCNNELSKVRSKIRNSVEPPSKDYCCPICNKNEESSAGAGNSKNGSWVVDHDHHTEKFRGWLCHRCNRALGCFEDDIERIKRAITYLRKANERT
jgi:hypothetical protein